MNPFNLFSAARNIPGVSQVIRLAGQQPLVQSILRSIPKPPSTIKPTLQKTVAVAPDVAIGLPVEYAFSSRPSPDRERMAAANVAAEIGTSLLLGGGEIPAQLVDLATSPWKDAPGVVGDIHAMAATLNPSNWTQTYVTPSLVTGKVDPEMEAYLTRQRQRSEQYRPQTGVLPTLIIPR